jgi:tRNA nucleotidyltransferase (CCA-adding enzyme)
MTSLELPSALGMVLTEITYVGGTPYLVGGAARDFAFSGKIPKDYDFGVYGIKAPALEAILGKAGRLSLHGKAFAVYSLTFSDGIVAEFSLPRRDNKTGIGHKGFIIEADPDLPISDALKRRDFTINALLINPFSGMPLDLVGARFDFLARILRPVSEAFKEDPLRVLRGFQFASRFHMNASSLLVEYAVNLLPEYATLPKERIWEEWRKWALGDYPRAGLIYLEEVAWLSLYPELSAMVGVEQDSGWHPEGAVFTHTTHVVQAARWLATREQLSIEDTLILVFAALCHDMGKPSTKTISETSGRIIMPGHEEVGARLAVSFLISIGAPQWLIERVIPLVSEHMIRRVTEVSRRLVRRLADRIEPATLQMLVLLMEADSSGRPPLSMSMPISAAMILQIAKELEIEDAAPKPILMGRHLLDMEFEAGPEMGKLLKEAFEAQLDGKFSTLDEAKEWIQINYLKIMESE